MLENNKNVIAIIIAGLLIAGSILFTNWPQKERDVENTSIKIEISQLTEEDHFYGNKENRFIFVEYSDFECPFCKMYHKSLKDLQEKYKDEVSLVFRHFPIESLHAKAWIEAEASECVAYLSKDSNDQVFWGFADLIFETTTSNDGLDLTLLPIFAEKVGVTQKDFNKCMDDDTVLQLVKDDYTDGKKNRVNGTPHTFLVDTKTGEILSFVGAKNTEALSSIIEEKLKN